ncbi:MAG TPA: L,D-transpeptidase [Actinomycetota bacterium]|nr:L,D-transpeptidase [Actinomycetota bacterium]
MACSTDEPIEPAASTSTPPAPSPSTPRARALERHLIGHAKVDDVRIYSAPREGSTVVATFGRVNDQGAPQVFLLQPDERGPDGALPEGARWVNALLPVRPNGTTGYLRVRDIEVFATDYRLEVDRAKFRLTLFEGHKRVLSVPVGIGTGDTPTPTGRFYLASLLEPPDPDTIYGPYAYGLSGYSETLLDWKGGGIIGLHGTNAPDSIGRPSSHGCIRMRNEDIKKLVPLLPLGTPIDIR